MHFLCNTSGYFPYHGNQSEHNNRTFLIFPTKKDCSSPDNITWSCDQYLRTLNLFIGDESRLVIFCSTRLIHNPEEVIHHLSVGRCYSVVTSQAVNIFQKQMDKSFPLLDPASFSPLAWTRFSFVSFNQSFPASYIRLLLSVILTVAAPISGQECSVKWC